tara:strand:+ start:635 stop:850 length:216 start_codon:yes stop_codon:yes gene_type:complete
MRSVIGFILTVGLAWAYVHVGFTVLNLVETRVWSDMTGNEKILVLSGSALVMSSIFWIYAIDVIMGKFNGR